jgi:hypothetical protein
MPQAVSRTSGPTRLISTRSKVVQLPGVRVRFTVSVVVGPIVDGASSFTAGNITGSAISIEPEAELLQLDSEAPRRATANTPDKTDFIATPQTKLVLQNRTAKDTPKRGVLNPTYRLPNALQVFARRQADPASSPLRNQSGQTPPSAGGKSRETQASPPPPRASTATCWRDESR